MKISIHQKVLSHALECGAVAAMSDEAQGDTSNLSLLVKSVKITVDSNFTVESATNLMAVKYVVPITGDCGIDVKEQGQIMIPAKEFMNWINKQGEAKIGIVLTKLDAPEDIKTSDEADGKNAIKKIGTVKFASKDSSQTGNRWSLDCYDPTQAPNVNFTQKPATLFEANTEQVVEGIKYVSIASQPKHYEHVFDSVLFETHEKNLYMATTDTTRCAIFKLDKDVTTSGDMSEDLKSNKTRLLVPCNFLGTISKLFEKNGKMTFSYDKATNRLFISQPNFEFRVAIADADLSKKFPLVGLLLNKSYSFLCSINKEILVSRIATTSMVNKNTALFRFKKADNNLTIKAISECGMAPSISISPTNNLSDDKRVVWAVNHLSDAMKVVKDNEIVINMPSDNNSFKVTSVEVPNFTYYAMAVNNPKYAVDSEE